MSLKDQLTADMKTALKGGDKERLQVIRLILADIKRVEVDTRETLSEAQLLTVLEKAVKQRRDSVKQFTEGGREDLAAKERAEIEVLEAYLPAQLSEAELNALLDEVIAETGAESIRDMGKVMGAIKNKAAGKADMGAVGALVKARLGQ
ncbi:MAG: GatB/YqeY domain-containing protein [Pseudomonadota bacterium]